MLPEEILFQNRVWSLYYPPRPTNPLVCAKNIDMLFFLPVLHNSSLAVIFLTHLMVFLGASGKRYVFMVSDSCWHNFPVGSTSHWHNFPVGTTSLLAQLPCWHNFPLAQLPSGTTSRWLNFPMGTTSQWAQLPSGTTSRWHNFPLAQLPSGSSSLGTTSLWHNFLWHNFPRPYFGTLFEV